ncbi:MAG: alginate O-acetyltransferase AlgX-related protein [Rhodoferax sp.]
MNWKTWLAATAAAVACAAPSVAVGADAVPVLYGKDNEWLFTPYEFAQQADVADTNATIELFGKLNKLFEKQGIALALVIVPSKIRIHADQLPASKPLDAYTEGKYENAVKALKAAGVNVVNLNQPFLASPHRASDTPLFLRLDTHWSPSGAALAAETIKAAVESAPALKTAWAATPEVAYTFAWNAKKSTTRARDLVRYLPPEEQKQFRPEQVLPFKVARATASQVGLQGAGENVGILVIGSSYTNANTGYPDAIRYQLQRDLLDISIQVDKGPWVGMEEYLKDGAYKSSKPKLIIWEIPERELRSPPNAKFRDARYQSDNNEWLKRITDLLK